MADASTTGHTSRAHALLSPSGASRWFYCTKSAKIEDSMPSTTSEAAEEGTLAHELAELLLTDMLLKKPKRIFDRELAAIKANELYTNAMLEHCTQYAAYLFERYTEALATTPDAQLFIEERLDLSDYIPDSFGTGDAFIIGDKTAIVADLKYGKGILVPAEDNLQLKIYALGWLARYYVLYDIETIELLIYQPRLDNIVSWSIGVEELSAWAEHELMPRAKAAFEGTGEFSPGTHCRFCKLSGTCKALAEHSLGAAKDEFSDYQIENPNELTNEEMAHVLDRIPELTMFIKAVQDAALKKMMAGEQIPNFKLVEGRSNRIYKDEKEVAAILKKKKYRVADITEQKMLTITQMEEFLGKEKFNSILGDLIIKPEGSPTVVAAHDKRPAIGSAASAQDDFADIEA